MSDDAPAEDVPNFNSRHINLSSMLIDAGECRQQPSVRAADQPRENRLPANVNFVDRFATLAMIDDDPGVCAAARSDECKPLAVLQESHRVDFMIEVFQSEDLPAGREIPSANAVAG